MRRVLLIFVAMATVALSGCGTFSDRLCGPLDGGPYYRGVQLDVRAIREGLPFAPLLVADLPLSAVADTLLIPSIALEERARKQRCLAAESQVELPAAREDGEPVPAE